MLYKNLPRNVGLRRLTLHKSATGPNVNYILLVECSHFLDNINQVLKHFWEMRGSVRSTMNRNVRPSSIELNLHLSVVQILPIAALSTLSLFSLVTLSALS